VTGAGVGRGFVVGRGVTGCWVVWVGPRVTGGKDGNSVTGLTVVGSAVSTGAAVGPEVTGADEGRSEGLTVGVSGARVTGGPAGLRDW
jgi:hypothetical protein